MSIIESFDITTQAVISPADVVQPVLGFPEIVVVTFDSKSFEAMLRMPETEHIVNMYGGRTIPIYKTDYKGKAIAFYHSLMGGAAAAALLEEILVIGGQKILFFGSCGVLDKNVSAGHYIVPTAAYRDEGASYHYAPASEFINIKTADRLAALFDEIQIPSAKVRVWTTDSFYRETRKNIMARRNSGCVVVEMECASIMAVAQFRKADVFQFLYAADSLAGEKWEPRILGKVPTAMREQHIRVAMEIACRL